MKSFYLMSALGMLLSLAVYAETEEKKELENEASKPKLETLDTVATETKEDEKKESEQVAKEEESVDDGSRFIELSLFAPKVSIHGPDTDIRGLRLGLIYSENRDVRYVDFNVFAAKTLGTQEGFVMNLLYNRVEKDSSGVIFSLWNSVEGHLSGGTITGYSESDSFTGVALGIVNRSEVVNGLQIGLVNYAKQLHGLQIGLVNIAYNSPLFHILPVVNFNF